VNLALARGFVGREGCGLMPIRGHSGVQGGAEMGAYATALPGGLAVTPEAAAALSERYGFPVPPRPGLTAAEMLESALRGDLDVLYSSGGNFLEVLPDVSSTTAALERVPLRVHQDIVVSSQMLVDGETVVLLPAATRYEQRDGGTETTTERRIAYGPEVAAQPVGQARSEWEIFIDLARRVDPERAHLVEFETGQEIRDEIARIVPLYAGIETLHRIGDSVQWGGTRLCEGGVFPTDDGKGRFSAVAPVDRDVPEGRFRLSTRRGKQFNTMVYRDVDPLTGGARDSVFVSAVDAARLGLADGAAVVVRSDHGHLRGHLKVGELRPGNAQMFWPEGNALLPPRARDSMSGVPDYNAVVEITPV
jgi:predicted molibdopterin-dependent oxidoreductase YjgC